MQWRATLCNLGVQNKRGKKYVLNASMSIPCVYKALKSCEVRYIKPHELDQKWWSVVSTGCETRWNTELFVTCSSYVQHQQLSYNCYFRSKHNLEQETTSKLWRTALRWMSHQTLQCQPSSSSQCPPSVRGNRSFPRQRANTTKHHHVWLRFRKFALQKTAETSGHILFSRDLCILEDLGSVPYVHCSWLSIGSIILDTAPVLVLQ